MIAVVQAGGWPMKRIAFFAILFMALAATAQGQDPQEGARWTTGQARSPNGRAPTFVELANTPGMTTAALTVALTTPHAGMPMFVLTPEQRQDIIAYILSLKVNR
jgi:hypothetical protein